MLLDVIKGSASSGLRQQNWASSALTTWDSNIKDIGEDSAFGIVISFFKDEGSKNVMV